VNRLTIDATGTGPIISRYLYGQFAEHLGRGIYDGLWVGEDSPIPNTRGIRHDVVAALRKIKIPVLRWPGGCFADTYHWRDGIGPREERPTRLNIWWGGVTESNHFGTHEFFDLCEMLGAAPYICGNVGSGTVQEMADWVEYCTSADDTTLTRVRKANGREQPWKLPFFGVGNENWGCGGQMRPEYYADQYRQYQGYLRDYAGNSLYKIAGGSHDAEAEWTDTVMRLAGPYCHGLSFHQYTFAESWDNKGAASEFTEAGWFGVLRGAQQMHDMLTLHGGVMDRHDPEKRVGLIVDEWGTWYDVEPGTNPGFLLQQNSLRDALLAGIMFHTFHQHCERVKMANIAQTVNVLQAMALTEGARMVLTPTYHVFELFTVHHDATRLPSTLECADYTFGDSAIPQLSASASRDATGTVHISLCNTHPEKSAEVRIDLNHMTIRAVSGRLLTADIMQAHNTFAAPHNVAPTAFTDFRVAGDALIAMLPAKSVSVLAVHA
jgi:alpha-N-arabinofuranosidase